MSERLTDEEQRIEDLQVMVHGLSESNDALRARVAKLEAALKDLRSNVDYHGHKKLDAALSETVEA